jgi:uncharacterized protein (DUF58 family)
VTRPANHVPPPLVLSAEGKTWVWVTVLLAAVGWYKSITLVLVLGYLMLALLVVNGWLARRHAKRAAAALDPPAPGTVGTEARVQVSVTNVTARAATVGVEARVGPHARTWLVHALPGHATAPCRAALAFTRRGRYRTQSRVTSGYPFGLLRYSAPPVSGPDVVVLPAEGAADVNGLRRWLRQAGGDGRSRKVLRRVTTDEADVRGVRPFRPGDAIRSVHWRSTARRRELMVREYDAAPALDLVLVVEPWVPVAPTAAHLEAVEAALSLAVTLALAWSREYGTGVVVAVAGAGDSVRAAGPSEAAVRAALEPLAGVTGAPRFEPFGPRAFSRPLGRAVRLLVSSRPDSPYAGQISGGLGRAFLPVSPADPLPWYRPPGRA